MSNTKTSRLSFDIKMDENTVPEEISWSNDQQENGRIKAIMASMWDEVEANTIRIDLWTKGMMIEEMNHFFVQSLLTMADTFERATGDQDSALQLRNFGTEFGKRLGVLKEK